MIVVVSAVVVKKKVIAETQIIQVLRNMSRFSLVFPGHKELV